jgi:dTDP-glucose pyrophosphorylase
MAGESRRFTQANFTQPKWSLLINNKPVIYWAIQFLIPLLSDECRIIFGVKKDYRSLLTEVFPEINNLGEIFEINEVTKGQAHTVSIMTENINAENSLLVWNCDSYIYPGLSIYLSRLDNFLLCAALEGEHWSFVRSTPQGEVLETAEKIKISNMASLGLYSFSSVKVFQNAFLRQSTEFPKQELYVAPLYNKILRLEMVSKIEIHPSLFIPFGTPQEFVYAKDRISKRIIKIQHANDLR